MPRAKSTSREYLFDGTTDTAAAVRVGGRVKKAKIVFDPSINNMPKKRSTRSISVCSSNYWAENQRRIDKSSDSSRSPPVLEPQISDCCMICGKVEAKRIKKLIACKDCNYKVHSSCLKLSFQNLNLLEEHWRCDNCRTCVVCYETSEVGTLITCCVCVDAYHLGCHNPRIISKLINKLKWECAKCQNINRAITTDNMPLYRKTTEVDGKLAVIEKEIPQIENPIKDAKLKCIETGKEIRIKTENMPRSVIEYRRRPAKKDDFEEVPDITDWSCERVSKYMMKYFPDEAHVFRDHEIDGQSLLLMKRSDVVEGLDLKLGPAIRMYSFIVRLQTKSNDPRLTWM